MGETRGEEEEEEEEKEASEDAPPSSPPTPWWRFFFFVRWVPCGPRCRAVGLERWREGGPSRGEATAEVGAEDVEEAFNRLLTFPSVPRAEGGR